LRGMKMNRREFFRLLGGAALLPILSGTVFPKDEKGKGGFDPAKLVVVDGDSPEEMVYAGLEALGGLKRIIRKGAQVLIKPKQGRCMYLIGL